MVEFPQDALEDAHVVGERARGLGHDLEEFDRFPEQLHQFSVVDEFAEDGVSADRIEDEKVAPLARYGAPH